MEITITRSLACTGMTGPGQQRQADLLMSRLVTAYWPDAVIKFIDGGNIDDEHTVTCDGDSGYDYQRILHKSYTVVLDAVFDGETDTIEQIIAWHTPAPQRSVHVAKNQLGISVLAERDGDVLLSGGIDLHDSEWFLQIGPRDCDGYWIEPPLEACVGSYIEYDAINLDAVKLAAEEMARVYDARQFFPRQDCDQ